MKPLRILAVLTASSSLLTVYAQREHDPMPPTTEDATLLCPPALNDQGAPGNCIGASSVPMLGMLYPLSEAFFVNGIGQVGIGTTTPFDTLHVEGNVFSSGLVTGQSLVRSFGEVHADFGNTANPGYRFGTGVEGTGMASPAVETLTLSTNHSERLRITSTGFVQIGATAGRTQLSVHQRDLGFNAPAILGINDGTPSLSDAVAGSAEGGRGVYGFSNNGIGLAGATLSSSASAVHSYGDLTAGGTKFFVQPHPTDSTKEVRFICLEGNESGTYFRGSARLENGRAVIEVPEEFRLVSEPDGLTVQLTLVGGWARIWVESKGLDRIVVRGDGDIELDYFVNGVRRGFADVPLIRENRFFVPETSGEAYGTQYPEALRRILVENGTLNPDFTPNETTALRNGWELRSPHEEEPRPPRVRSQR